MDWLRFVAALVKALAWPLTVLAILFVLRRPLVGLLPLLGRLKFRDLELDFGRRLAEASAEAAVLPGPPTGVTLPAGDDALLRLAAAAPRAAILESWLRLEAAALAAARRRGTAEPISHLRSPIRLIEALREGAT